MSTKALDFSLPPPEKGGCDVLIIAGEHSGDQHAALMVEGMLKEKPDLRICTLGGPALKKAGAQLLHDMTASSVVGFVEVIKHYSFFKDLFEKTVSWISEYTPKAVCFVDYPGFNLRLAQHLCDQGLAKKGGGIVGLHYYIGPQIWAWKAKRRFKMAEVLDSLAVIFPFEVDCYKDTSLQVDFVGHPFVDASHDIPVSYSKDAPLLLLPGSRKQAVGRIFPVLLNALDHYRAKHSDAKAVVIYPDDAVLSVLERCLHDFSMLKDAITLKRGGGDAVEASAVLTSSGTMSLNVALAGIPGAIVYRANWMSYLMGRFLLDIEYLGIANILLDKPAWPEYIQGAASPKNLVYEIEECTKLNERRKSAQDDAEMLKTILKAPSKQRPEQWLLSKL